ncbi:hypothetical protein J2T03_003564 [Chryseobacterium lathyri]|nr:hypothetical protein [Chryseobacterium lathyri]
MIEGLLSKNTKNMNILQQNLRITKGVKDNFIKT